MQHPYLTAIASTLLLAASASVSSQGYDDQPACVAIPIFHCVEHLDGGGATAHFGYDLQCAGNEGPNAQIFIDIGDDNLFSPGRIDRGQPKVFISGEHFDEYEADFTAVEVTSGTRFTWSVLERTATVDFIKTQDDFVDCMNLKN